MEADSFILFVVIPDCDLKGIFWLFYRNCFSMSFYQDKTTNP